MKLLRLGFAIAWVCIAVVSVHAVASMGVAASGDVFLGDFAHPWRAQFYTDFTWHALTLAGWIWYREESWAARILCSVSAVFLGGLFTFAYLFVTTYRAHGDAQALLLGNRHKSYRS